MVVSIVNEEESHSRYEQRGFVVGPDLCEFIGPRSQDDSRQLCLLWGRVATLVVGDDLAAKDGMRATNHLMALAKPSSW